MFNTKGLLYPDSVVGTDSHTTMIDGLGVAGWGVGGIEAEATMLGQVKYLFLTFDYIPFIYFLSNILPHLMLVNLEASFLNLCQMLRSLCVISCLLQYINLLVHPTLLLLMIFLF